MSVIDARGRDTVLRALDARIYQISGCPTVLHVPGRVGEQVAAVSHAWRFGFRDEVNVPLGTSHLVEHLLAESAACASGMLARMPTDSLAESRRDYTVYGAAGSSANILDFVLQEVTRPMGRTFTKGRIKREAQIIGQEYDALVDARLHGRFPRWTALDNLYLTPGERSDGYGDIRTLAEIRCDLLEKTIRSGYRLDTSVLCVVADWPSSRLLDGILEAAETEEPGKPVERVSAVVGSLPRCIIYRRPVAPRAVAVTWPLLDLKADSLVALYLVLRQVVGICRRILSDQDSRISENVDGSVGWQNDPLREGCPTSLTIHSNLPDGVSFEESAEWLIGNFLRSLGWVTAKSSSAFLDSWILSLTRRVDHPLDRAHLLAVTHLVHGPNAIANILTDGIAGEEGAVLFRDVLHSPDYLEVRSFGGTDRASVDFRRA